MTLQEQRDIIQAAIDGKPLELTEKDKGNWRPCKPSLFNFWCCDYRVKPEPREWDVRIGEHALYLDSVGFRPAGEQRIKVREVLE